MGKRGGFPGGFGGMNINNIMKEAKKNASRFTKISRRNICKRF